MSWPGYDLHVDERNSLKYILPSHAQPREYLWKQWRQKGESYSYRLLDEISPAERIWVMDDLAMNIMLKKPPVTMYTRK
jgi:hypothetical protein